MVIAAPTLGLYIAERLAGLLLFLLPLRLRLADARGTDPRSCQRRTGLADDLPHIGRVRIPVLFAGIRCAGNEQRGTCDDH